MSFIPEIIRNEAREVREGDLLKSVMYLMCILTTKIKVYVT